MAARITPNQIKKTNRQLIYDCIYREKKVSQQDLSYLLHLSRPTVAANLASLEEEGLIRKNGQFHTDQIGRKAVAYSIDTRYRVGLGVELRHWNVKIIAVDLYGQELGHQIMDIPFENTDRYYQTVSGYVLDFIAAHQLREEQILGAGFTAQGITSPDGTTIVYGAILNCTGLTIDVFSRHLNFPCIFVHDPDSAALSELWYSPDLTDAIYLSMSRHLGASSIIDRKIRVGKHGHSATFEHIPFDSNGSLCYCGKRGCLETVCSAKALLGDEEPQNFFRKVRAGSPEESQRWSTFLGHLANVIGQVHLVQDVDFVLGGHLAPYFTPEDIQLLYDRIQHTTPFQEEQDFIRISKAPAHNIALGAALPYIQTFLKQIEPEEPPTNA